MAWKIVFSYTDGSQLKISKSQKKLPIELAEKYQKEYARTYNDGGMVYHSPYKECVPVPLKEYCETEGKA